MANKTAEEILRGYFVHAHSGRGDLDTAGNPIDDKIAEASRQLYEATMAIIGPDIDSRRLKSPDLEIAIDQNALKVIQRAKARAFYGITETEKGGE